MAAAPGDARSFRTVERVAILSIATVVLVWALSTLWYPFFIDQGIHAWAGSVVVAGGMPYRDALDNRGPLAFYVNAVAQWILGHNTWGIRVVDLVLLSVGSLSVYRALAGWTSRQVALIGATFVLLWHASYTGGLAQPDVWVGLLLAAGLSPFVRESGLLPLRAYVVAGIAVAIGTLNKPFYGAFLVLPAVHLLFTAGPLRARATALIASGIGFVLPLAVCALWFASQHSLDDLIDAYILFNLQVYAPVATSGPVTRLMLALDFLFRTAAFTWAMPIAVVGPFRSGEHGAPLPRSSWAGCCSWCWS
jgi:hypothetical protein